MNKMVMMMMMMMMIIIIIINMLIDVAISGNRNVIKKRSREDSKI